MTMQKKEGLVNVRPAVIACLSLTCGIFCAYRSFLHGNFINLIAYLLCAGAITCSCFVKGDFKKRFIITVSIISVFFFIGNCLSNIAINKSNKLPYHQQNGQFTGRIYEIASYEQGYLVYFDECEFEDKDLNSKARGFIFEGEISHYIDIGARVGFEAKIVNRVKENKDEAEAFSGVYYELEEIEKVQIIDFEADFFEIAYLNSRAFLKKHLSKDASGIALALLLGDTTAFNKYKLENYRMAGIAHIFAVSGLHVGLMVGIFTYASKLLKIKRKFKPFFILIPAFIYCGLCGFRPSALRAFIMASVTILADTFGFKKDNLSSCAIAGIALLLINPFNLMDYGFKLSFMAVSSIFLLQPLFTRHAKSLKWFGEPLSLSLSAQIGTLPILTRMSGYTSIIAIFSNLIFVPVTSFIYTFTFISFVIGAVCSLFSLNASFIMKASDLLISSVDLLISKIDFSIFAIPTSLGTLSVIWYLAMACMSDYVNLTTKQKLILGGLSVLLIFGGSYLLSLI